MRRRLRVFVRGAVQGVGFRPFVFLLAEELGLPGWVLNDARGVQLELDGEEPILETFLTRLRRDRPPLAVIHAIEAEWHEAAGFTAFEIRRSEPGGERTAVVLPDLATCPDCLREVDDPKDRRHGYAFTNCTRCGPRFSIVRALPYDRPNTTMAGFALCEACRREYEDPRDRRFHAQPTACPKCGPALALWSPAGEVLATGADALSLAANALHAGRIVAVKGLGGFHLLADARRSDVVRTLRARKARWGKPLALLVRDLAAARLLCRVPDAAALLLASPSAPIVLLPRRVDADVAPEVAPDSGDLGLMLPSTPLHHLLCARTPFPLVATSGNLSEEPLCTDERDALERLGGIADLLLVHDRPIERHVDDSVAFVLRGETRLLRRARGFAPLPVRVDRDLPPILAVGAEQKVVVALAVGRQVFLSQHIGDLATPAARAAFERVIADFERLYGVTPAVLAHDLHPDLASSLWAQEHAASARTVAVQHHHAHLASCLADNGAAGRALGVTFDGTGLGTDGTIWGGELLVGDAAGVVRAGHLRPFRLPGGEAAVREPRRAALALLWEALGQAALERDDLAPIRAFTAVERTVLRRLLSTGTNAPVTTSAGRLFDGVAALLGLHPKASYDGQAAMALQQLADPQASGAYPLPLRAGASAFVLDWSELVHALLADLARGEPPGAMSMRFHRAVADGVLAAARHVGEARVALTGGCFQNRLLAELCIERLERAGHEVLLHRQVPPNDGGLSLGQVLVAAARM